MAKPNQLVRFINPPALSKPNGYSHIAEITGGILVFISGQVPLDGKGNLVGENDLRAQAIQVFTNIGAALAVVGADFKSVVKLGFYLTDISQIQTVREVRDQFLDKENPPTSTAVEINRLFREGILIEVEAIAAINE